MSSSSSPSACPAPPSSSPSSSAWIFLRWGRVAVELAQPRRSFSPSSSAQQEMDLWGHPRGAVLSPDPSARTAASRQQPPSHWPPPHLLPYLPSKKCGAFGSEPGWSIPANLAPPPVPLAEDRRRQHSLLSALVGLRRNFTPSVHRSKCLCQWRPAGGCTCSFHV